MKNALFFLAAILLLTVRMRMHFPRFVPMPEEAVIYIDIVVACLFQSVFD